MSSIVHDESIADSDYGLAPQIHRWILRMLVPLGGHRQLIASMGYNNDSVVDYIGLTQQADSNGPSFDAHAARTQLRKLYLEGEERFKSAQSPSMLKENLARLADLVGLNEVDCQILAFVISLRTERILDEANEMLTGMSSSKTVNALSVILGLDEKDVRDALGPKSNLARSGLVLLNRRESGFLTQKLELISNDFADQMCSGEADPVSLLRGTVNLADSPLLSLSDYSHQEANLKVLVPYLRHVHETRKKGVNLFLYGAPGTGKSQLAKVLAKELGCELFEVASENAGGYPVSGIGRLHAFCVAQSFFAMRKSLILFDEMSDVFADNEDDYSNRSTANLRKAWVNRLLEENPVPALWLSNGSERLDPAFIRRFDMVIELAVPPKKQRKQIIEKVCQDLLDEETAARIAESEILAPATITRAADVVNSIRNDIGKEASSRAVELLISNTLAAQAHPALRKFGNNEKPIVYDPAYLNVDVDLNRITKGVISSRTGRFCLYGPPGTGKTEYGRWLAEQMELPLVLKRGSDLLSKWVGGTEKNISNAFQQAKEDGAVLLIDEIDSFLQERRNSLADFRVGMVNEMLTQMESFNGIFIATTNYMAGLDQASLRRFDIKAKFDYIKPAMAWELFNKQCAVLGISSPTMAHKQRLGRQSQLTPGDFATVARQHRLCPIYSAEAFLASLEAECRLKEGAKAAIGFI